MIVPRGKFLKEVVIIPTPDEYQANIAAVDLRIGQKSFDPHTGNENETLEDRTIQIYSGKHFLIQTLEYFEIPNDVMGVVYPRSGTNRKGITLDMTGVVDPGYKGHLMLPITNLTDGVIEFHPGERIAQICFHRIEAYTEVPRESKYQNGGISALPDKENEKKALEDGTLYKTKVELLNRYKNK